MTTVVADCDWDWTRTGVGLTGITLLYFTLTSRWLAGWEHAGHGFVGVAGSGEKEERERIGGGGGLSG